MNILIFPFAFLSYILSTFLYGLNFALKKEFLKRTARIFFLMALCIHILFTLVRFIEAGYTPITNLFESFSFFSLCIAVFFFFVTRIHRIESLSFFVSLAISIMLSIAFVLPNEINPLPPVLKSFWLPIHTVFSFLGNAIFFLGFIASLSYIFLEKMIKEKRLCFMKMELPSLETLDLVNHRCLSLGFPMLTIGIVTGSIWANLAWGSYWNWDPKETWSLITWIVYAIIMHKRVQAGWRGKKTAYMMILGFLCVLFTFLGVNLLIGGQHSYV